MPHSYQDDQEKKLSSIAIAKERKISCVGASMLMSSWAKEKKKGFVPFFLTSRKTRGRNHTHVYVGFTETHNINDETALQKLFDNSIKMLIGLPPKQETRWYHLNEEKGLHRIENPGKIPVSGLQEAMGQPIDFVPEDLDITPPEFQIFTSPEALEAFYRFDFKFRAQNSSP
jgi:hypothetical protein